MFSSKKSGFIRCSGKGGQGVVTGTKLFFECIKEQYGNPDLLGEFIYAPGAERRGTDISAQGIIAAREDSHWLNIQEFGPANIFAAFSEDIAGNPQLPELAKPGGKIIINSKKSAEELMKENSQLIMYDLFCVDATETYVQAFQELKGRRPSIEEIKPNGPMVAAMGFATGLIEPSTLYNVISKMWGEAGAVTILSSKLAYDRITHSSQKEYSYPERNGAPKKKIFMEVPISSPDRGAGGRTGAWRMGTNLYINLSECKLCSKCADYCPEGAIDKMLLDEESGDRRVVRIDADYCKGCGICATICPTHAIYLEAGK